MEEKQSASIKPYLDKLTLGVTRILGEWQREEAAWGRPGAGGAGCGGHLVVTETALGREGRLPQHRPAMAPRSPLCVPEPREPRGVSAGRVMVGPWAQGWREPSSGITYTHTLPVSII